MRATTTCLSPRFFSITYCLHRDVVFETLRRDVDRESTASGSVLWRGSSARLLTSTNVRRIGESSSSVCHSHTTTL
ncbi:hypothetical protein HSB1_06990 [Halogranum salarium B-1]|uniref:Uncharacterized protein n=1 Tax=Halogranum salarium B-1 TaxID=1210908 RepID=J3JGH1_9EURY|nr:hypothetical protein HSB1_06990 [Halogranum salarium B-1]